MGTKKEPESDLWNAKIGQRVRIHRRFGGESSGIIIKGNSRTITIHEEGVDLPLVVYRATARSANDHMMTVRLVVD